MANLGTFIEAEDINQEIRDAISEEQAKAFVILNVTKDNSPKEIVQKIREYVDSLFEAKTIDDFDYNTKKNLAITLGSAWGMAVCDFYKWTWQGLRREDEESAGCYVVSPKRKFCCPPFAFILKILEGANDGLDGRNDNTVMLLFNMLSDVESQNASHNYMVLM